MANSAVVNLRLCKHKIYLIHCDSCKPTTRVPSTSSTQPSYHLKPSDSTPISKSIRTKSRYHAKITLAGKLITSLPGRLNTRAELDSWLATHWSAPLSWSSIPDNDFIQPYILQVWEYAGAAGGGSRLCMKARALSL